MHTRRIYNPIQRDYVTFLKTSDDTNGEYTVVEVELAAGGGVAFTFIKPTVKHLNAWKAEYRSGYINQLLHPHPDNPLLLIQGLIIFLETVAESHADLR